MAETSRGKLDLNRAAPEDLRRLSGVSKPFLEQIIMTREKYGRFGSWEDVRKIPGARHRINFCRNWWGIFRIRMRSGCCAGMMIQQIMTVC